MRHAHSTPGANDPFWDRPLSNAHTETDDLIGLQAAVLESLEVANHPSFEAADTDPAINDDATDSQRKAWLAIYGPLTDVAI